MTCSLCTSSSSYVSITAQEISHILYLKEVPCRILYLFKIWCQGSEQKTIEVQSLLLKEPRSNLILGILALTSRHFFINPLTPKISLIILLTVCDTVLVMLV